MTDIIKKDTTMKEAESILKSHGCPLGYGWELVIGMLLSDCDYLEVHDFGRDAYFSKMTVLSLLGNTGRK